MYLAIIKYFLYYVLYIYFIFSILRTIFNLQLGYKF